MNLIKKIFEFIKKIFYKKEEIKMIEAISLTSVREKKKKFIKELKEDYIKRKLEKKKIETLICVGDGLGIQKKVSC